MNYKKKNKININYLYLSFKNFINILFKKLIRKFTRQSFKTKTIIFFTFLSLVSFLVSLILFYVYDVQKSENFLRIKSCPACLGFKACEKFYSNEFKMNTLSKLKLVFGYDEWEIPGENKKGEKIIFTKLGNSTKIKTWENQICSKAKRKKNCHVSDAAYSIFPMSGWKFMTSAVEGTSLMTSCPSSRMMDSLQFRYKETLDPIDTSTRERIQLVLSIWLDPKLIMMQMFKREDQWPFHFYLGSCGRVGVFKQEGITLNNFWRQNWIVRTRLALKILKFSYKLTTNDLQYGLYLTSCQVDDFVVIGDQPEHFEVLFSKPETIIVVDRWDLKKKNVTSSFIRSTSSFCELENNHDNQFKCKQDENWSDNKKQYCQNYYTDHNYYAICRNIFNIKRYKNNFGLLHHFPENMEQLYNINNLLERCFRPREGENRSEIVVRLIEILSDIIQDIDLEINN